jgi:cytochrome c-type biogenesis protein
VILGLAALHPKTSFVLLLVYALGLGIPFLLMGAFVAQASRLIMRHLSALKYVNIVFGVLLTGLGILVFTQNLSLVANWNFINHRLLK